MGIAALYEHLVHNGVSDSNRLLIKKELEELESRAFFKGYITAMRHVMRRKETAERRRSVAVKCFLDYLSDITHGSK